MATQRNQCGATLIELIMVVAILGVIAVVASVFIKAPVDAYVDSARRAALSDTADTAMRRMARDIRKALPNSARIPNPQCLEFIPTKTAGRYRAAVDALSTGNILNFLASDSSFNMLGLNDNFPAGQQIEVGDMVAVYNLGVSGANAYTGDNTSLVTAVDDGDGKETTITIVSKQFPIAPGGKRFYVVPAAENIVAYVCDDDGNLRRTVRTFADADATCPVDGPILASNVSNVAPCKFVHDVSDLQRNEPMQLTIVFTDTGESISLYHQVYQNNWP